MKERSDAAFHHVGHAVKRVFSSRARYSKGRCRQPSHTYLLMPRTVN